MRRQVLVGIAILVVSSHGARADDLFQECLESNDPTVTVGVVECQKVPAPSLGGTSAISYYVPPNCAPDLGRLCPVLYYFHGTGGTYREFVGQKGGNSAASIKALTSGPPVDPRRVQDPWNYVTSTWIA